jgi:hypothetical protein
MVIAGAARFVTEATELSLLVVPRPLTEHPADAGNCARPAAVHALISLIASYRYRPSSGRPVPPRARRTASVADERKRTDRGAQPRGDPNSRASLGNQRQGGRSRLPGLANVGPEARSGLLSRLEPFLGSKCDHCHLAVSRRKWLSRYGWRTLERLRSQRTASQPFRPPPGCDTRYFEEPGLQLSTRHKVLMARGGRAGHRTLHVLTRRWSRWYSHPGSRGVGTVAGLWHCPRHD